MSVRAAPLLLPAFEASGGRAGRLSIQTDPTLYRDAPAMVTQAFGFTGLAPNVVVKFPTTAAGVAAMEEASFRGISVNATVSFSVSQALAAAEAVERAIQRRAAEGMPTDDMGPVITIMMGRIEDWLRVVMDRDGLVVDPAALPWSGVAVFKRAYAEWQSRGFRARLLGAAIRHQLHWSELIGGDVVITMPSSWQRRFNASSVEVRPRIDDPVPHVDELIRAFPDFLRAYEPDGLSPRRVRHLGTQRPNAPCVHRLVPRAPPSRHRRAPAEPGHVNAPREPRLPPGEPVTPERAGWRNLFFEVVRIGAEGLELGDPRREEAAVILEGGLSVDLDGRTVELPGRASVWDGLPWAVYLPAGSLVEAKPTGDKAIVAIAASHISAREGVAPGPVVIGPEDVRVEVRGAGNATRQINHIITPDFPADRLEVVEVYTPSGNWSSWPPHKHDTDDMPREAVLEEVYSYAFRRPEAWGVQRSVRGLD